MPDLLSPLTLSRLTLRNRIVMPPMWSAQAAPDGLVTPNIIEYHRRRAAAGCGLIIVEHAFVHPRGRHTPTQIGVHSDATVDGLGKLAAAIRREGAAACLQMSHAGSRSSSRVLGMRPLAPSSVRHPFEPEGDVPEALTPQMLPEIVRAFGDAAERALAAGFQAVEIHAAHGFLLCQFLSPLTNRREDEYGGPVENRCRLHLAVLNEVLSRVGADCPVFVRLGAHDETPGGLELDDACKVARWLADGGASLIDVSGGLQGSRGAGKGAAYFVPYAQAIKAVVSVPVLVTGGIATPDLADRAVREGWADLVGIGRAMLNDPDWARKAIAHLSMGRRGSCEIGAALKEARNPGTSMKKIVAVVTALVCVLLTQAPTADDGMWTFDNPPLKIWKEKYKFEPTPQWLEHVRLASPRVEGASGAFVSANGLIITNQHVANGQLQKLSTPERNYVRDGFYAPTLEQELKCPDIDVNLFVSYEDVTARVQGAVKPGMTDRDAAEARRAVTADVEKKSTEKTGLRSEVVKLYSGGEYWLYRYKRFADVRLVFAVEEATGFFGGDYDNFTYPRYDLDVAFFRAYENGRPARTEYLTWSPKGADEQELVFAIGSPGTTSRLLTMAQIDFHREVANPTQMAVYMARRDALARYGATSAEAQRRASAGARGIENSMKRLVGQQNGLENERLMAAKMAEESKLRKVVAGSPEWQKAYGDAWDQIAAAYKKYPTYAKRNAFSTLAPSRLAGFALSLVRYAEEAGKPNGARLDEFRDTRLESLKTTLFSAAPVYPDMEEALLNSWLRDGQMALGNDDAFVKAALAGQAPAAVAKAAVGGTRLADSAFRKALFESGPDAIARLDDPMMTLARRVDPVLRELRTWIEQNITNVETTSGERIAKARFAVYGKGVYPDANSTVRISYGTVLGYEDGTTLVPYRTTFYGLYDRATAFGNKAPFFLPQRWFDRRAALDMSVPLNFAYTADTIGGNSGSPVINRKGELVGLNFDSNRQKLANRYMYIDEAEGSRAVGVHSAGIIEALARIYGAERIVKEIAGR